MILCKQVTHNVGLRKTLLLLTIAVMATTVSIRAVPQFQDTPIRPQAFEVASIKFSDPNSNNYGIGTAPGGRFMANNWTLKGLIGYAYRVQDDQISGGPPWVSSDRFDIVAKAEEGSIPDDAPSSPGGLPPIRYLVQTLLAERFNLKLHQDVRELPTFELMIAKSGSKLQMVEPQDGVPEIGVRHIDAKSISIGGFCAALALELRRTVVNKTGLDGTYQVHLEWGINLTESGDPGTRLPAAAGPTIFTAIEEQLGLRLESRKTPMQVLIVDSADKPQPN
jgi:uncharacterized protein (TIGR03435 family)